MQLTPTKHCDECHQRDLYWKVACIGDYQICEDCINKKIRDHKSIFPRFQNIKELEKYKK